MFLKNTTLGSQKWKTKGRLSAASGYCLSYGRTIQLYAENQRPSAGKQAPQTHLKANKCLFLFSLEKKKKPTRPPEGN